MELTTNKKKYLIAAAIFIILIVLAFIFLRNKKSDQKVLTLKNGNLIEAAYAVGSVKAERVFNLKTGVSSKIVERFVRIGDFVKKGAPLVQLEDLPLYRSPFDGVITSLNYEKGELVFAQTSVLSLVDTRSYYLELSLDERNITAVRKNQKARVSFEGERKSLRDGTVRSIYSNNGDFLVAVDMDFSNLSVLPGMTCDVAIQLETHKDVLLVPLGVIDSGGKVTVLKDGKPNLVSVVVLASDGEFAMIAPSELKEGDLVQLRKNPISSGFGGAH